MSGILYWLVAHSIQIEVGLVVTLMILGFWGSRRKILARSRCIWRTYLCAIALACMIGAYIVGMAILSQYDPQSRRDAEQSAMTKALMSLSKIHGDRYREIPDCSEKLRSSDDPNSEIVLKIFYSLKCDPNHVYLLESVNNDDAFVRFAAVQSWLQASYHPRGSYTEGDLRLVRQVGRLMSTGQFPSEMSYQTDGHLALFFRQWLREKGLVWFALWSIPDTSLSTQIAFKELARIGVSHWWAMTTDPAKMYRGCFGGATF